MPGGNQHTRGVIPNNFKFRVNRERRTMAEHSDADLLQMLANGHRVCDIARGLNVSRFRVTKRLRNLYRTLGVVSPTGAVIEAVRIGLLKLEGLNDPTL